MNEREQASYVALRQMAENMPPINKHITPKEWDEAQERVKSLARQGYRLDGAPATASIYGVMRKRATASAVTSGVMSEDEKVKARNALMAEIERMRGNDAGRDAEAADRGEPQSNAGAACTQAGADGVPAEAAGRDRQRWNADRGDPAQADGSGSKRAAGGQDGARVVRPSKLSPEVRAEIYDKYASSPATRAQLAEEYDVDRHTIKRVIEDEAERRGEAIPPRKLRQQYVLPPEQQIEFYREYVESTDTMENIAAKWGLKPRTAEKYIQRARLAARDTTRKPTSRKSHNMTDDQIRECGRRRDAGETTVDIAAEMGVSIWVVQAEIRRVCGNSKAGHAKLTPELRAAIVQEYKHGDRTREIAAKHHISTRTLTNILVDAGVSLRNHPRAGLITEEVLDRVEYPNIARWMSESGTGLLALSEKLGVSFSRLRRWLTLGESDCMTKGAIDKLIELTDMPYDELFAAEISAGGVKATREELEAQLQKTQVALSVFAEWLERIEHGENQADGSSKARNL